MKNQNRTVKVWAALVASMTVGALVLMAVDRKLPPGEAVSLSAPGFSLSGYYKLDSIDKIVLQSIKTSQRSWDHVQVFYSGTGTSENGKILQKHTGSDGVQFHFLVCNGILADDGQIQYTPKWENQESCMQGKDSTIRICVVSDGVVSTPSDIQIKRVMNLVRLFAEKYRIPSVNIAYPADWQM